MAFGGLKIKKDPVYRHMYRILCSRYGVKEANELLQKAGYRYDELVIAHADDPFMIKLHKKMIVFKGIALYGILCKRHPDVAMEIMEQGMKAAAEESAAKWQPQLSKGRGRWLFMSIQEFRFRHLYTDTALFSVTDFQIGRHKRKMKVDIDQCLYHEVCKEEGFRELTHVFCDYDVYFFAKCQQMQFHRTTTIGHDGKKCDFYIARRI